MTLEGAGLRPGCSGGPVVDPDRGSVIGVIKGRARDGRSARATPITALRRFCDAGSRERELLQEALRAHDRHHLRCFVGSGWSWPREQYDLEKWRDPGGYVSGFHAHARAELFGLFAELPPPGSSGEVQGMVEEALRGVLREEPWLHVHSPRSWRDGVGLLYDEHDGRPSGGESSRDRERAAVVLYSALVFRTVSARDRALVPRQRVPADREEGLQHPADPVGDLRTWITNAARHLPNGVLRERVHEILTSSQPRAPRTAYADVLVEIDPDLYGTHPWRIKLVREDGQVTPVRQSETGVARAELERDIRAALADALDKGDIGEHLAAVDFRLPRALFDEPVEMWRAKVAAPDKSFDLDMLPLAYRRSVALRDHHRSQGKQFPEWHQRWSVIKKGRLRPVALCTDTVGEEHSHAPPESREAAYIRLSMAAEEAVPVHCARAGGGAAALAMDVALGAGFPVVLWRRCDERHSDCEQFRAVASELLRHAGCDGEPDSLRRRVSELRNRKEVSGVSDAGSAWAGQLVLLYDPPQGQRGIHEPLREPAQRS